MKKETAFDAVSALSELGLTGESWFAEPFQPAGDVEPRREPNVLSLTRQQSSLLAQLRVPVSVKLPPVAIPAAALIDLAPGATLEYACNLDSEVELVLGADLIASGRLVERDGQLGIEVTAIVNDPLNP